jgi:hypothetical protein
MLETNWTTSGRGKQFNLSLDVGTWDIQVGNSKAVWSTPSQVFTAGTPQRLNAKYVLHAIPHVPALTLSTLGPFSGVGERSGVIVTYNVGG